MGGAPKASGGSRVNSAALPVLAIIVAIYALGIVWLRKLARFDMPQRLLGTATTATTASQNQPSATAAEPETVAAWREGSRA